MIIVQNNPLFQTEPVIWYTECLAVSNTHSCHYQKLLPCFLFNTTSQLLWITPQLSRWVEINHNLNIYFKKTIRFYFKKKRLKAHVWLYSAGQEHKYHLLDYRNRNSSYPQLWTTFPTMPYISSLWVSPQHSCHRIKSRNKNQVQFMMTSREENISSLKF